VKWYEKINNPDPGKWKYERREWLQLLGTDLRFVNVGQETAICANKILVVMRSGSAEAKRKMKDLLLAGGKILDITSGLKARSIIILDNWSIIISPIKPITLMNKINTMLAMFTLASVAWADRTTATSNVYGFSYSSSVVGEGLSSASLRKNSKTCSRVTGRR
jgi:regulator of extracellular matrix RemA (YlzA/DUF370 family)